VKRWRNGSSPIGRSSPSFDALRRATLDSVDITLVRRFSVFEAPVVTAGRGPRATRIPMTIA